MLQIIGGAVFILVWLAGAAAWGVASMTGGLMANDAGTVSADKHASLLVVMAFGEALVAFAGIAGGAAFFWVSARGALLVAFVAILLIGAALQIYAVRAFFGAVG
jgi:hypothetical protein